MNALNLNTGKKLSNNIEVANNLLKRLKGLLGKSKMLDGEALWIKPCMSVHTLLMKFPIDIVFLSKRNQVIAVIRNLQPNHITRLYSKAASVLELPAGILEATETRIGDKIEIT